jgi:hypothetical protein
MCCTNLKKKHLEAYAELKAEAQGQRGSLGRRRPVFEAGMRIAI